MTKVSKAWVGAEIDMPDGTVAINKIFYYPDNPGAADTAHKMIREWKHDKLAELKASGHQASVVSRYIWS